MPPPLHIANLGSSFAAGPSIQPVADRFAARSGANYAALLAARVGARLTDLSASGATLLNLLSEPQEIPGHRFPPQVDRLPADTDVVLVLGGGDDLGYVAGFFTDTASSHWIGRFIMPDRPDPGELSGKEGAGAGEGQGKGGETTPTAPPPLDEAALAERYGAVLDAIHAKAPRALVLVVEYLTMLGSDARPGVDVPFDARRAEHHRRVARTLQRATALAAQSRPRRPWCVLVPVAEPSRKHGLGAGNPWVSGFTWRLLYSGGAYHPNAEGMRAVAEILYWKLFELGVVDNAPGT
ncbi:hypothetical protein DL769_008787 [Monosporascus sp. CRB-8-3]|nr:hypothetical protein DL769_008787 [Monosporascus sp. CRB-8-3]